jgi:hypothetical protein
MTKKDCPLCHKELEKEDFSYHSEIEEVLLDLIRKNHPQWVRQDGACPRCVEYYRAMFGEEDGENGK